MVLPCDSLCCSPTLPPELNFTYCSPSRPCHDAATGEGISDFHSAGNLKSELSSASLHRLSQGGESTPHFHMSPRPLRLLFCVCAQHQQGLKAACTLRRDYLPHVHLTASQVTASTSCLCTYPCPEDQLLQTNQQPIKAPPESLQTKPCEPTWELIGSSVHQVFLTPTHLALAMEYAPGGDLYQQLTKCRPSPWLPENEARFFFQQLIIGLDYCHRKVSTSILLGGHVTVMTSADWI